MSKDGKATVGAWVTVQDGELEELWRIVPRTEADVLRRKPLPIIDRLVHKLDQFLSRVAD